MGVIPVTPLYVATISDLAAEVLVRCENRVNDTARAKIWVKDALLEISGNADYREEFDDLEVLGPVFDLTPNLQEYPMDALVPSGDYNLATLDIMMWIDPPTNSQRIRLDQDHFQNQDTYQFPGQPSAWYRFGANVGFGPTPMTSYQVQARILRRHPIADDSGDIGTTVVLLPREWHEIIEWAAVIRGFMELLEFEKAGEVRTLLYGDPKDPKKVGLINSVKRRRQLEAWRQTHALQPVIRGYGYGRS